MAFFKFRKDGDEHTTPSPAPESVEAMRKRAKHRLIGAAVLVAIGVIGFPLLFDNQPRPISVDLPINIPDKNAVKPLGNLPVGEAVSGSKIVDEIETPSAPALAASRTATGTLGNAPAAEPAAVTVKPVAKVIEKPAEKPAEKIQAVQPKPDGSKAQALLEGKGNFVPQSAPSTVSAGAARYVVQVGAFSDAVKARDARLKLESAGLKTYTQVVTPKEGKRIRVRVGPFETKADADRAAAKIKKLDLPAAILEL